MIGKKKSGSDEVLCYVLNLYEIDKNIKDTILFKIFIEEENKALLLRKLFSLTPDKDNYEGYLIIRSRKLNNSLLILQVAIDNNVFSFSTSGYLIENHRSYFFMLLADSSFLKFELNDFEEPFKILKYFLELNKENIFIIGKLSEVFGEYSIYFAL